MAYAAAALGALQVWSGYQQANMTRDSARLTQAINDANAGYLELDAMEAEKLGYTQSTRYQSVIDSTVGEQRVAYAAQNVDVSFGTAAEVQKESKFLGFLNQLEIQNAARARAKGLKIEASNLRLGGQMGRIQSEMEARSAITSGILQGAQTGISYYYSQKGNSEPLGDSGSMGAYRRVR